MRWLFASVVAGLVACSQVNPAAITCTKHDDCKGITEGYCSRAGLCTRECSSVAQCKSGEDCFDAGRRQVCLPTCTDDAGCPTRFGCRAGGSGSVCQVDSPLDPPN